MKTTNIWYKTLPGLRPAAVAPQEDMPGTAVGPGAFLSLELMDYIVLQKSRISLMGSLPRLKPFSRDIVPGAAAAAGAKPPGTS
jgi:hypothetical protein